MRQPSVSIIIPCRDVDPLVIECVGHCSRLDYEPFEIILLPDTEAEVEGVRVVPTGPVLPGRKRNLGASVATGAVYAYIDSDAYPRSDWLASGVRHLQEMGVGAVGGPAITAPSDDGFCQAQGTVLSSFLMSGTLSARYRERSTMETDDIHSVNLIAWKEVVNEIGGWNEKYWPGEDTLFGLAIRRAGYKQLLASDVVVYHHRRGKIGQYLHQIGSFGIHRGYFAKKYPETSRRLGYFVPAVALVGLVLGLPVAAEFLWFWWVYVAGLAAYLASLIVAAGRSKSNRLMVFALIPLTHLAYGLGFIRGLLAVGLSR